MVLAKMCYWGHLMDLTDTSILTWLIYWSKTLQTHMSRCIHVHSFLLALHPTVHQNYLERINFINEANDE